MRRRAGMALLPLVVLAGAVLGWVSCSDGNAGDEPAATAPTAGPGPATGTSTSPAAPGSRPVTAATAEGWRFTITRPRPGATVGRSMTVCTEISGTSREPALQIEATLARQTGPASADTATGVGVGRDSLALAFPNTAPGRYDLTLRLNVDRRPIPGLHVTIPGLRLTPDTPPDTCDA